MRFLAACFRAVCDFFAGILFGCSHSHVSRPFTIDHASYEVCLDCGKQIAYSVQEMRPLTRGEIHRMKIASAGELKVVPLAAPAPILRTRETGPRVAA